MTKTKTYDSFKMITVNRSDIHGADYNPRKITEASKKKLRKKIREYGLVQPIIINLRTMNIVGGHQRISILDDLSRGSEYELQVAAIDVDQQKEVEINVFLNNPSAMGEWDDDLLVGIHEAFPEIDFADDLGFDKMDLDCIFSGSEHFDEVSALFSPTEEQKKVELTRGEMKEIKERTKRDREKAKDTQADFYDDQDDNYMLTVVFNNNAEKRAFMLKAGRPDKEKFMKGGHLYELLREEYRF